LAVVSLVLGSLGIAAFLSFVAIADSDAPPLLAWFLLLAGLILALAAIAVGKVALPKRGRPGRRTALVGICLGLLPIITIATFFAVAWYFGTTSETGSIANPAFRPLSIPSGIGEYLQE
jgi:hypothetical protein